MIEGLRTGRPTRRLLAVFVAVDCLFVGLVSVAFLNGLGAHSAAERTRALAILVPATVPALVLLLVALARALAPVERWLDAERSGAHASAELLAHAEAALHRIPGRAARYWSLRWGGLYTLVAALYGAPPSLAGIGCFLAAV